MDVNKLNALDAYQSSRMNKKSSASSTKGIEKSNNPLNNRELKETEAGTLVSDSPAAVYEKSDLITSLQKDAEARIQKLKDMVKEAITTQGGIALNDENIWRTLASGRFTVTAAAKEEAQKLISEDGYYGVEQTSERILQFAKALSGGDSKKADELLNAFKKGYKEATKTWGKALPDICKDTYSRVEEKFSAWKNESTSGTMTE